jgi:hypothetical protein
VVGEQPDEARERRLEHRDELLPLSVEPALRKERLPELRELAPRRVRVQRVTNGAAQLHPDPRHRVRVVRVGADANHEGRLTTPIEWADELRVTTASEPGFVILAVRPAGEGKWVAIELGTADVEDLVGLLAQVEAQARDALAEPP